MPKGIAHDRIFWLGTDPKDLFFSTISNLENCDNVRVATQTRDEFEKSTDLRRGIASECTEKATVQSEFS